MPGVENIIIALTAGQAGHVRRALAEGRYASTREAVRDWRERRDLPGFTAEALRILRVLDGRRRIGAGRLTDPQDDLQQASGPRPDPRQRRGRHVLTGGGASCPSR
jgi:hypothetical protein